MIFVLGIYSEHRRTRTADHQFGNPVKWHTGVSISYKRILLLCKNDFRAVWNYFYWWTLWKASESLQYLDLPGSAKKRRNGIFRYHTVQDTVLGKPYETLGSYDLMEVVIVNLGDADKESDLEILDLLNTLFSLSTSSETKKKTSSERFWHRHDRRIWKWGAGYV